MVKLTCPRCHGQWEVSESVAGEPQKCPACGAEGVYRASYPKADRRQRAGIGEVLLFAMGMATLLLGTTLGILYFHDAHDRQELQDALTMIGAGMILGPLLVGAGEALGYLRQIANR